MQDRTPVPHSVPRRRRCPRCGGPAIVSSDPLPGTEPVAVCINCGHEFPVSPPSGVNARSTGAASNGARSNGARSNDRANGREFRIPTPVSVVAGFLLAGLMVGVLLAVLQGVSTAVMGGWLLIFIGVGLVAAMGAFEAGYLDGLKRRLRASFGHTPGHTPAPRRPPSDD